MRTVCKNPSLNKAANGLKIFDQLDLFFPRFKELVILIDSAIMKTPSSLKEGNIIKTGYDQEIDRLRDIKKEGKLALDLEQRERENRY